MTKKNMLIAANWKMNPAPDGFNRSDSVYRATKSVDVVVFPTYLDLHECIAAALTTGAQHGRAQEKGAFTGDVSMKMLRDKGCTYVLCGHSERRREHGETDEDVASQVQAALAAGLIPIACVGETVEDRTAGRHQDTVKKRLSALPVAEKLIIAYEPFWAIGNGKSATPADAEEMHAFIRSIPQWKNARILYGGSLNAGNAEAILRQKDVDGALIGGASLRPEEFAKIVEIAAKKS